MGIDLKNKRVLVTGGCGLIGSTLIDQLVETEQVAEVVVLDNLTRGTLDNIAQALSSGSVSLVRADVRDFDAIRRHFDGIDVVFHQAAIRITACAEHRRECQEVLVDGTYNVVEACAQAGVGKLVAASSASVYGMADDFPTSEDHSLSNNRTWYGAAKIANEALYRAFHDMTGLDYVALRYFNVYGPRMDVFGKYTEVLIRWLDCLDRGERPKIFGDGRQTMDFVFSEDVARANVLAAKSNVTDEIFNVASGVETSLAQLLEHLLSVTGHDSIAPEHLPERSVNSVQRRLGDATKAEASLGFRCSVDLKEGLARLVDWRKQVKGKRNRHEYDPDHQAVCRA